MQILAQSSPAYDFHIFVGTSVRLDVIKNHYEDLIRQYSDASRSFLAKLGYKGDIPSYEATKEVFEKKCFLMLGFALILGNLITNDTSSHPSPEEMQQQAADAKAEGREVEAFNAFEHMIEGCTNMYKSCIRKCIEFEIM
uniref:Uncharacterized protein n=1 Tax=Lygus hesperus TaxID=30085 RepID=A0A0K8SHF7_LYGHE